MRSIFGVPSALHRGRGAALLALCGLLTGSCSATSRFGQAEVTQVRSQPCFSIPDEPRTRFEAMRLFSIAVSETQRVRWDSLPTELWGFLVEPQGQPIGAGTQNCVRYGEVPPWGKSRSKAAPLRLNHVYVVEIDARPANRASSTLGYKAEFCLKRADEGRIAVEVIPWDETAKRWRYERCATP